MSKDITTVSSATPTTGPALYRASTDAAGLCRDIVIATAKQIQGRKYVCVEGWQAIAIAHGCVASAGNVEKVDGGFRATGRVIRMDNGIEIATAEGFVGDDESMWAKRPEYARRAMAQTRAISRACRSAFAHVVVMIGAGLSTTPAEEVPFEGFDNAAPARDVSPITPEQSANLRALIAEVGADTAKLCAWLKVESVDAVPAVRLAEVVNMLERKRKG